jgi:nucleoside-diphosphate-sugar epimerase
MTVHLENSEEPNLVDLEMQFPSGLDGDGLKYQASKILAHQASQQFLQKQKPHFTLITLHPTFVLGPSLVQKSAGDITGVVMMFMHSLTLDKPVFPSTCVDVRDVADAIVATIDANVERNGEEFIITGPKFTWEDVVEYTKAAYPQVPMNLQPPFDKPFDANASKAERLLGAKWRSMEEMVSSVLDQQLALAKESKA